MKKVGSTGKSLATMICVICFCYCVGIESASADGDMWDFNHSLLLSSGATDSETGGQQSDTEGESDTEAEPDTSSKTKKPPFSRRGFYLGAGGTYAYNLFGDYLSGETNNLISTSNSAGINAVFGYRLLRIPGVEAGYEWVRGFVGTARDIQLVRFTGNTFTGNIKLFIPLGPIQPNVLAGIGATRYAAEDQLGLGLSSSSWAYAIRLGGGVDVYLTRHFLLNGTVTVLLSSHDFDDYATIENLSAMNYVAAQFGFQYRF